MVALGRPSRQNYSHAPIAPVKVLPQQSGISKTKMVQKWLLNTAKENPRNYMIFK